MRNIRKKWSGDLPHPEAPDLVLSRAVNWTPDSQKKYSTLNGYEPNNITAAVAWTRIPEDLIASDAFIYKDKKTGLWVQAVGYPLIPLEKSQEWVDLQMANGAQTYWTSRYAVPRLPQKPYTLKEVPAKTADKVTYIEVLAHQNKFMVNGVNLCDLNPLGQPKDIDIFAEPPPRPVYQKRDTGVFHIRSNSKFVLTPKGVYFSVSAAAADMGMSFSGITHHIKKGSKDYRFISAEEYQLRVAELNKNETTE
jgi:hypothetical protein